jgi:hypothetical protein
MQLVLSYNLKGNAEFTPSALAESRDEIVVVVYDKAGPSPTRLPPLSPCLYAFHVVFSASSA